MLAFMFDFPLRSRCLFGGGEEEEEGKEKETNKTQNIRQFLPLMICFLVACLFFCV